MFISIRWVRRAEVFDGKSKWEVGQPMLASRNVMQRGKGERFECPGQIPKIEGETEVEYIGK